MSYIQHHGILGQKWGVRRYQNPDGSLTDAGKKRYLDQNGQVKSKYYTKVFGMSKKQYKTSYANSSKENVNKVFNEHAKALENNSEFMDASRKATNAWKQINAYEKQHMYNDEWQPDDEYYKNWDILRKESIKASKIAYDMGRNFINKYSEAKLKDIGYNGDISLGKQMVEKYSKTLLSDNLYEDAHLKLQEKHKFKYSWNSTI